MQVQRRLPAASSPQSCQSSALRTGREARRGAGVGGTLPQGTRNRTQAPRSRRARRGVCGRSAWVPEGRDGCSRSGGRTLHRRVLGPVPCASRPRKLSGPWPAEPRTRRCLPSGSCCPGSTSLDSYGVTFVTSYSREPARSWVIVLLLSAGGAGGLGTNSRENSSNDMAFGPALSEPQLSEKRRSQSPRRVTFSRGSLRRPSVPLVTEAQGRLEAWGGWCLWRMNSLPGLSPGGE